MTEVVWLLAAALVGFLIGRFQAYRLQHQGEALVSKALIQTFQGPGYHLLNSVTLPTDDGSTQKIGRAHV